MTGFGGDRGIRRRLIDDPSSSQALLDLGLDAFRQRAATATAWLGRGTATTDDAGVHFAFAVACPEGGKSQRALARSLAVEPDYTPAWLERAYRDRSTAVSGLQRAMAIEPSNLALATSLAGILLEQRSVAGARTILDAVLDAEPDNAAAWTNRGRVAVEDGNWALGLTCARRAVAIAPSMFEGWLNIGGISEEWGERDLAARAAGRAVVIEPCHPQARWNRTLMLLGQGDWRRGFADFDVRLEIQQAYPHVLAMPRWDGAPLPGRLLVHDEIGYGDVFNFLRYVPMARARVGALTLEVKPGLLRLLNGFPGADRVVERGSDPPAGSFDAFVPIESLPALFSTTVDTVPPTPCLLPPLALTQTWARRVASASRPRVGLCWAGNPLSGFDRKRSCRLADLEPILDVEGLSFISLQKNPTEPIADRVLPAADEFEDFADTAAVIAELDLVISVETSVAHLAGVMGRPVWILLAPNPAWRWLRDREDTPWYPSARLMRLLPGESWFQLTRRVASELRARFV